MPVNAPVFDETILVDTLLDNDENIIESIDSLGSPTLSKVQIGDITSFLAKTGIHQVCTQFDQRGSAGAENFTNYIFCHPQFSGVIQNIENRCANFIE